MFNWSQIATDLDWQKPYQTLMQGDIAHGNVDWFVGGQLNAAINCLDRHLLSQSDKIAMIWEGNLPEQQKRYTYAELTQRVCQFAHVLSDHGVQAGDVVCLYMPLIPEAIMAMLACARIGAIHSVVFGGFSASALHSRLDDAQAKYLITATAGFRGEKRIPFLETVNIALGDHALIDTTFVVRRDSTDDINVARGKTIDLCQAADSAPQTHDAADLSANDPLFILYTSGSTGKPKGIVHALGGYLAFALYTYRTVFNPQPDDIYWCTADVGWITGHTYLVYGPLAAGSTILCYEGVPAYPSASRLFEMIDRHQVSIFYTAPTLLRSLMRDQKTALATSSRQSLRVLGSVGEPINPEPWQWFHDDVGLGQCPIMDTWWQTETGGIILAPLVDDGQQKPGAAMRMVPGVSVSIRDANGHRITDTSEGYLVIDAPWPGMLKGVYQNPQRFFDTYLSQMPGCYFTGDSARYDEDGDIWIVGRVDDVLNVSGHRLGTAEVENALIDHANVIEAAVVGMPDPIKGEGIAAFVILREQPLVEKDMYDALNALLRHKIGPVAKLDRLIIVDALPKTRSGKIMRRILRKLLKGERDQIGDTSTLTDPGVIAQIDTALKAPA